MTFPLLLVALCLASLALALAIGAWSGHSRPAPAEAQRVTDAVERAALAQLLPSLPGTAGILVVLTVVSALVAFDRDWGLWWFLLTPALSGAVVAAVLYLGTQRMVRASGQLVGVVTTDGAVALSARSALSAALACDGAMGVLLVGLWAAASASLEPKAAALLCLVAALSATLTALALVRGPAVAAAAAHMGARASGPAHVHAGSLAALVSASFGHPVVRAATLISVMALGRATLLILSDGNDGPWIYPHLLQALGSLAIAFGFLTVRSSEREPGAWAWMRGGAVTFILLVASAWSLSEGLAPGITKRAIPSAATLFFVGTGLAVWSGGIGTREEPRWSHALRKLPVMTVVLVIVGVLLLSIPQAVVEQTLRPREVLALILASGLSTLPVAVAWQLVDGLFRSARGCSLLATEGHLPVDHRRSSTHGPGRGLVNVAASLWFIVCLVSLTMVMPEPSRDFSLLLFGLAAGLGVCLVLGAAALNVRAARSGGSHIERLVASHGHTDAPNLTEALTISEKAAWNLAYVWPLMAAAPLLLVGGLGFVLDTGPLANLALGLSVGGLLTALVINLTLDHPAAEELQIEGALVAPFAISQTVWALATLFLLTQF